MKRTASRHDAPPEPCIPAGTGIIVEFVPEVRLLVTEPFTGAEVPLGTYRLGAWNDVSISREPSMYEELLESKFRLRHDASIAVFDCPIDQAMFGGLIDGTIDRCQRIAWEIVRGLYPLPRHAVDVWPVAGGVRRIDVGENLPQRFTHLRRTGTKAWISISEFTSIRHF